MNMKKNKKKTKVITEKMFFAQLIGGRPSDLTIHK